MTGPLVGSKLQAMGLFKDLRCVFDILMTLAEALGWVLEWLLVSRVIGRELSAVDTHVVMAECMGHT